MARSATHDGGNWTLPQEATYQPDTTWRWMGSIASDHLGNLVLGFSASSSTINPQLRYAGRLVTDPTNILTGEQHLFDGTGSQTGTDSRWGDYSDLTIDPVGECNFYYTNEYYDTTSSFNWRTRIGYFKFTECTPAPRGTAHFVVTVCEGGAPLANAWVSVDQRLYGATIANGTYDAGPHTRVALLIPLPRPELGFKQATSPLPMIEPRPSTSTWEAILALHQPQRQRQRLPLLQQLLPRQPRPQQLRQRPLRPQQRRLRQR